MNEPTQAKQNYLLNEWQQIIRDRNDSGKTIKAYCEENNIPERRYYYWLQKIRQKGYPVMAESNIEEQTFVPVKLTGIERNISAILININDAAVTIPEGMDEATIITVLKALRQTC